MRDMHKKRDILTDKRESTGMALEKCDFLPEIMLTPMQHSYLVIRIANLNYMCNVLSLLSKIKIVLPTIVIMAYYTMSVKSPVVILHQSIDHSIE